MIPNKETNDRKNSRILKFEDLKRLADLVFVPSGYMVQLKDEKNVILWEDTLTTKKRGSREGEICYKVNFGRDFPCPHCTGVLSREGRKPFIKEDRSFIDGKWYRVIGLPIIYKDKITAIELIQEISANKMKDQVFDLLRTKDALVSNIIRHDIPSYIHNINFALEALQKSSSSFKEGQEFISIAQSNINKVISILEELRDLSKLDEPIIQIFPLKLIPMLKSTIDDVIRVFPEKKINIMLENLFPDENVSIFANNLVSEIFLNILTNSVKYTSNSSVELEVTISQYIDIQEFVEIRFVDNGIGIAPEIKEVLFDRSERIKRGWKVSEGSSGLGMMIIKSLVDLFGAEINYLNRIEDDWTKGTKVILRFPQVEANSTK
jgi:signal transduction histidine kinase